MLIEVIFLLILVAFVLSGYRKGLLMSLCSLLVLVLCSLGASVAQSVFTTKAVEFMEPRVQQAVEAQLQEQVRQDSQQAVENAGETGITIGGQNITLGDLVDLLDRFGLDVEQQVTEGTSNAMEPVLTEAAWAVGQGDCGAYGRAGDLSGGICNSLSGASQRGPGGERGGPAACHSYA